MNTSFTQVSVGSEKSWFTAPSVALRTRMAQTCASVVERLCMPADMGPSTGETNALDPGKKNDMKKNASVSHMAERLPALSSE